MTDSCRRNKQPISASEKIEIICQHIEQDFSKKLSLTYRSAVIVYVTMGIDSFPCDENEELEAIWKKTTQILDAENRNKSLEAKPNEFLNLLDRIKRDNEARRNERLLRLEEETGITPDEAEAIIYRYAPWLDDEEAVEAVLEEKPEWETYENLFEHVATGFESFECSYSYWKTKIAQANAAKHGNLFSFEETAEQLSELKRCQEEKDWVAWEQLLHKMYNAPTPHADMAWLDNIEDESEETADNEQLAPRKGGTTGSLLKKEDAELIAEEKQYISDVINFEEFVPGKINLVFAPCGCGKTTFIENALRNYADSIGYSFIYLAPTCALKEAIESRNNGCCDFSAEDDRTEYLQKTGITAMTYAKFGSVIAKMDENPAQDSTRYYGKKTVICLDEMQQGVSQMHYSGAFNNITRTALVELVKRAEDESNLVVAISATPKRMIDFLIKHYNCKKTNLNIIKSVLNLKGYEPKEIRQYNSSLESLINKLDSSQRGLIYIDQIDQINKATSLFEKRGIAAVGIWSLRSKYRLSDKQWSVSKSLIVNEKIPDDVQVLILNAAYQTGLNIDPRKTRLDYIVVHNSNRDVQAQVLGRYRGDIATAYLKTTEQGEYTIPQDIIERYLNRKLFKGDKDSLCGDINLTDTQGRLRRWPTIKKLLAQQGYLIEEGKSGSRYSLIKPPKNS